MIEKSNTSRIGQRRKSKGEFRVNKGRVGNFVGNWAERFGSEERGDGAVGFGLTWAGIVWNNLRVLLKEIKIETGNGGVGVEEEGRSCLWRKGKQEKKKRLGFLPWLIVFGFIAKQCQIMSWLAIRNTEERQNAERGVEVSLGAHAVQLFKGLSVLPFFLDLSFFLCFFFWGGGLLFLGSKVVQV